jgi:hypothetical protein
MWISSRALRRSQSKLATKDIVGALDVNQGLKGTSAICLDISPSKLLRSNVCAYRKRPGAPEVEAVVQERACVACSDSFELKCSILARAGNQSLELCFSGALT